MYLNLHRDIIKLRSSLDRIWLCFTNFIGLRVQIEKGGRIV